MANLSQEKRQRMLAFLDTIREEHKDDDKVLIALGEIESELNAKKYGLVWERHEEAVDVQMRDNIPVFTECSMKEIKATTDDVNFLLEGDNLHSLRLLEKTHSEKIDLIYIDPPYNRGGNDFRYDDSIVDKQDGFRHSKWLSFMGERLSIAWRLLNKNGVIFISIDDFEIGTLRMLCDDIFGEASFVCTIVWQKRYSRENREAIGDAHEYILVYAKDKVLFKENRHLVPMSEQQAKIYKNPNNDPKGRWRAVPMTAQGYRPNQMYPITDPKGGVHYPPEGRCWSTVESEYKKLLYADRIYFGKNNNSQPNIIRYLSEVDGVVPWTWWNNEDVGHTDEAKKELYSILGKTNNFETPKPVRLITRILEIASQKNSVVLDFFAGSGTTGQAVLAMNRRDGGNRKFILCTNNENNICEEVTYERIKRVIAGYGGTEGIPANLKYYRTDFVSKDSHDITDDLLAHIKEMIQLEHGINLDGNQYIMILSDEEADELEQHWNEHRDVKALYVSRNVLFTTAQNALFNDVDIHIIPDDYFKFELQEVGEAW